MTTIETVDVLLDKPLKRGDTEITTITLRRPLGGALRGTSTRRLLDMEVDDVNTVLPRISEPALTPNDLAVMDGADILKLSSEVAAFLLPKAVKQAAQGMAEGKA